jgi:hypothetical protein
MKKKVYFAATILIVLTLTIFALRKGETQPPSVGAVLFTSPSQITDPALAPGSKFAFNVSIFNVTNMVYCAFCLNYTPGIFSLYSVQKQPIGSKYPLSSYSSNEALGLFCVNLTYTSPVTLPEMSAPLLTLTFTVINYGITPLHFDNVLLKDNNGYTIPIQTQDGLVAIVKHDIAVVDVSGSPSETYVGRIVNITVTVQNNGNVPENFTTEVFAGGTSLTVLDVQNLLPNEIRAIEFSWNTSGFSPSMTPYTISAQAQVLPYETNTTNNVHVDGGIKLKIIGDVNGDGVVDINDLIAWDAALSNYNPQADLNGDGVVDKQDGILIILNYKNSV